MQNIAYNKARVEQLLDTIQKSNEELTKIRSKCEHQSWFVGMWSWRTGGAAPSRICRICQDAIPGVTIEEVDKFYEENPR